VATERRPTSVRRAVVLVAGVIAVALVAGVLVLRDGGSAREVEPRTLDARTDGIWISADEIALLPITGPAWESVAEYALEDWGDPALDDQNSNHDVHTLAGALYATRLRDAAMTERVTDALGRVEGTFSDEILALSRNLLSYVIAADVIGYRSATFDGWLKANLTRPGHSRAGIDTLLESALRDPNNHGAHARASVVAVARYIGDDETVGEVAARFRDWLGRSSAGFEWRELDWQADPDRPRGINALGSEIRGVDVDGVLPEEERRSGGFTDPPPQEPYVWEALQGTIATAELLDRAGFEPWDWEDQALRRAMDWLYDANHYPAEGDDRWIPWIVNAHYGTDYLTESPTRPGKNVGFSDWTHGR
jgi:Alginate lyase